MTVSATSALYQYSSDVATVCWKLTWTCSLAEKQSW